MRKQICAIVLLLLPLACPSIGTAETDFWGLPATKDQPAAKSQLQTEPHAESAPAETDFWGLPLSRQQSTETPNAAKPSDPDDFWSGNGNSSLDRFIAEREEQRQIEEAQRIAEEKRKQEELELQARLQREEEERLAREQAELARLQEEQEEAERVAEEEERRRERLAAAQRQRDFLNGLVNMINQTGAEMVEQINRSGEQERAAIIRAREMQERNDSIAQKKAEIAQQQQVMERKNSCISKGGQWNPERNNCLYIVDDPRVAERRATQERLDARSAALGKACIERGGVWDSAVNVCNKTMNVGFLNPDGSLATPKNTVVYPKGYTGDSTGAGSSNSSLHLNSTPAEKYEPQFGPDKSPGDTKVSNFKVNNAAAFQECVRQGDAARRECGENGGEGYYYLDEIIVRVCGHRPGHPQARAGMTSSEWMPCQSQIRTRLEEEFNSCKESAMESLVSNGICPPKSSETVKTGRY